MTETKLFSQPGAGEWEPTPDGNRRRILLHTPELMMVEFAFEAGAIGDPHAHPHVQSSYIAEGEFEVTIDGHTETIPQGGTFIVPSGLTHGVRAIKKGRLIDNFTPARQDFL